jgi:hypothetical protein
MLRTTDSATKMPTSYESAMTWQQWDTLVDKLSTKTHKGSPKFLRKRDRLRPVMDRKNSFAHSWRTYAERIECPVGMRE